MTSPVCTDFKCTDLVKEINFGNENAIDSDSLWENDDKNRLSNKIESV